MNLMEKAFKGISIIQFYKWASVVLTFGIIGSAINTKMQWEVINIGGKISMISAFFFQCLLLTLFLTLYIQMRKQPTTIVESPEIDDFLKKLQQEDVKGGSKNGKENNINN